MPPQRSNASPLRALQRSRPSSRPSRRTSKEDIEADVPDGLRLDDCGAVTSLAHTVRTPDVPNIMQHVLENMFETIPEHSGLNSTRTAEVLNLRRKLPPLVTTTHIHALSKTPTTTEREIGQLIKTGVVRKLSIPGRGLGSTAIGELLVLTKHWEQLVLSHPGLSQNVKEKYLGAITENTTASKIQGSEFTRPETIELVQAGFFTSTSASIMAPTGSRASASGPSDLSTLALAGSRAPTGSIGAVGGLGAVHNAGGSGVAGRSSSANDQQLSFSLPSVGLYLRLLSATREHFLSLLTKSRPFEAPVDLLRERWDGGVASADRRKHGKGIPRPVLPGRTRKWRQFYGVKFQWILEECFGTGAVELFETGAVGLGARIPR